MFSSTAWVLGSPRWREAETFG